MVMREKIDEAGLIRRFGGADVEEAIRNAEIRGIRIIRPSATERKLGPDLRLAGRNSACPCGSGKKFKRCCLPKIWAEKYGVKIALHR
jgi:hypothetical protein